MAGYGLGDWYARELRLTVFPIDAVDPGGMKFWEALTGSAPNEVRNRPPQRMVSEEGPLLNGWLRVEANSNRIDWRLLPPPGLVSGELPVVGPYDVPERDFRELMRRWGSPTVRPFAGSGTAASCFFRPIAGRMPAESLTIYFRQLT